jgi:hypothetical protein
VQLQLGQVDLALRADYVAADGDGVDGTRGGYAPVGRLTSEEQAQFASLAPASYAEAIDFLPRLQRFQRSEVENLVQMLR